MDIDKIVRKAEGTSKIPDDPITKISKPFGEVPKTVTVPRVTLGNLELLFKLIERVESIA